MDNKVFVYGTLRQGHYNHSVLEMSKAVPIDLFAKTKEKYIRTDTNLPKVYNISAGKRARQVDGELYAVPDMVYIDRLEGHPILYRRDSVDILDSFEHPHKAWLYFYNGNNQQYVGFGNTQEA
tara:strand:- start:32 stop:400 length:369 start_codon:yes stop_codon:yes gene_type:complete